jgi:hypothetical protein
MSIATLMIKLLSSPKTLILAIACCVVNLFLCAEINLSEISSPTQCFFLPPKDWEIADPSTLSPHVKIAFLKRSPKGFYPSINLAIEETQASLHDYLKAVRTLHEDHHKHWRALGKVRTPAGLAQLTEIDSKTDLGPVRILQLILLKEGYAYILTAAALKEEISDYYKDFQSAFRSLTLTSDLIHHIPQLDRREMLREKQQTLLQSAQESLSQQASLIEESPFQEQVWLPFQQFVTEQFKDMGAFWQILLLKNTQEKLLSLSLAKSETDGQNSQPEIQSVQSSSQEPP